MEDKDKEALKGKNSLKPESHVFYIAVLIIVIVGILLFLYFPSDEKMANGLLTAVLTWISAIVGFYFGSKPVNEVVLRLEDKEKQIAHVSQELNEYLELSQSFQELYEKTVEIGENLNSKNE